MRRSKVWIVHDQVARESSSRSVRRDTPVRGRFNFEDAEHFGDVEFILDREYSMPDTRAIVDMIHDRLKDYNPQIDYIVLVGSPVMMGTVTAIAAEYGKGFVQFLRWIKNESRYSPVTIYVKSV